jgi:hypothetical protein
MIRWTFHAQIKTENQMGKMARVPTADGAAAGGMAKFAWIVIKVCLSCKNAYPLVEKAKERPFDLHPLMLRNQQMKSLHFSTQ